MAKYVQIQSRDLEHLVGAIQKWEGEYPHVQADFYSDPEWNAITQAIVILADNKAAEYRQSRSS